MKRLDNQIVVTTVLALATLITAEAASARPLHQGTPQAPQEPGALYSRMIAPGG